MKKKICFVASSGGHLEEISRLREIRDNNDCFLVTEKSGFNELKFCDKVFHVCQINRKEPLFIFKFVWLLFVAVYRIIKERPSVIITTGALAAVPFCLVGKLFRKKIIYIESFARMDTPSLTGRIVYKLKLANLFIVQWEECLKFFPDAVVGGRIF